MILVKFNKSVNNRKNNNNQILMIIILLILKTTKKISAMKNLLNLNKEDNYQVLMNKILINIKNILLINIKLKNYLISLLQTNVGKMQIIYKANCFKIKKMILIWMLDYQNIQKLKYYLTLSKNINSQLII